MEKAIVKEFPFDRLHTVQAVAERLSLSESQVRALAGEGEIEGFKLGGALRISESSVLRYLARCRIGPGDPPGDDGDAEA